MERLKALFPTLAHMESHELLMLPLALIFLFAPATVLIKHGYQAMGWVAPDNQSTEAPDK